MNEGLNTLSAADVAAVTRNNDGNMWGDGGWFWMVLDHHSCFPVLR